MPRARKPSAESAAPAPPQQPQPLLPVSAADVDSHAVIAADVDHVVNDGVHRNKQPSPDVVLSFLTDLEEGSSLREAAIKHALHIRTAQRIVAKHDVDLDQVRASFRRMMQAEALDRLDDWRAAADVGAHKKGNHSPAKEWLLHAGVIEPLDTDHNNVRVSIHIGTPEQPMKIVSPLTQAQQLETTTSSGSSVATDVATQNRPE